MPSVGSCTAYDPLIVAPDTPLADAARRVASAPVGAALVLDGRYLVGLLAREWLERALRERDADCDDRSVRAWMLHHPESIDADAPLEEAALLFLHGGLDHLPVTKGDDIVGLLSRQAVERVVELEDRAPRGV